MRITFVLPSLVSVPVGGIKVVYELANRMSRRGHAVTVLHLGTTWRHRLHHAAWRRGLGGWFALDPGVASGTVDAARPDRLPEADVLVACGWRTAGFVHAARSRAGRPHYFGQGYMATLEGAPGEVDAAWRLPLRKIVVARWLAAKARELGGPDTDVVQIPLAIDHERFRVLSDSAERRPATVALLNHHSPAKGARDGLEALEIVHATRPDLAPTVFGADAPDHEIPDWATFERLPRNLPALYNRCAVFVHPSHLEGWPLTPAEAMSCGCAVAAYANDGVAEYAIDERNALLVPIGDVAALAGAVRRLIEDRTLRLRLAAQGVADISAFTWERTVTEFEAALTAS